MKLTIAEPQECPVSGYTAEVATETREYLQKWFGMLPADTAPATVDPAQRKAEHKALKDAGRAAYAKFVPAIESGYSQFEGTTPVSVQAGQFIMASLATTSGLRESNADSVHETAAYSYMFEGMNNAMSQHLHTLGVTAEHKREAAALLGGATNAPSCTSGELDRWVARLQTALGTCEHWRLGRYECFSVGRLGRGAFYVRGNDRDGVLALEQALPNNPGQNHMYIVFCSCIGVLYVEDGVAWFAGYSSVQDLLNRRFTRQRAAAVVKHCTGSDTEAARAADIIRAGALSCDEVRVFPNDVPFGPEYYRMNGELESCMSHHIGRYNTWASIYPVDVYSSAYFGKGDNGLALIECALEGTTTARGILNTRTGKIVRWYGEHRDELCVTGLFGIEVDSDALEGSWLALVEEDGKCIGPYLDGYYDNVETDRSTGRLNLCSSGERCLDDTDGIYYMEEREMQTCCLSGDEFPEEYMVYQPDSDTYYHEQNEWLGVRHYGTGEYIREGASREVEFEGDTVYLMDGEDTPYDWVWVEHRGSYFDESDTVCDINGECQLAADVVQNRAGDWVLECDYDEEADCDDERECA